MVSAPWCPEEQHNPGVGNAAGRLCLWAVGSSLSCPGSSCPVTSPGPSTEVLQLLLPWLDPVGVQPGQPRSSSTSKSSSWLVWLVFLAFLFPPFPVGFVACPEALVTCQGMKTMITVPVSLQCRGCRPVCILLWGMNPEFLLGLGSSWHEAHPNALVLTEDCFPLSLASFLNSVRSSVFPTRPCAAMEEGKLNHSYCFTF